MNTPMYSWGCFTIVMNTAFSKKKNLWKSTCQAAPYPLSTRTWTKHGINVAQRARSYMQQMQNGFSHLEALYQHCLGKDRLFFQLLSKWHFVFNHFVKVLHQWGEWMLPWMIVQSNIVELMAICQWCLQEFCSSVP